MFLASSPPPSSPDARQEFVEAQLATAAAKLYARDLPAAELHDGIVGDLFALGQADVTEIAELLGIPDTKAAICQAVDRMSRRALRALLAHLRELRQFGAYMRHGAICDALNVTVPAMSRATFMEFVALSDRTATA